MSPNSGAEDLKICVITATYNAAARLPTLIESLRSQTDKDFEWVVADGASTDGTLDLLRSVDDLRLKWSSRPDFGIYDALNRALQDSDCDYYIVAGADDKFYPDAVARYRVAIESERPDIVVAYAMCGEYCFKPKRGSSSIVGEKAYIGHHSLATAFNRRLHDQFGMYSRRFPIAADSHFVLRACKGGASRVIAGFVAGEIGIDGVSARDWAGAATELFRVQLSMGCGLWFQVVLLVLRLTKGASKNLRSAHDRLFRQRQIV